MQHLADSEVVARATRGRANSAESPWRAAGQCPRVGSNTTRFGLPGTEAACGPVRATRALRGETGGIPLPALEPADFSRCCKRRPSPVTGVNAREESPH